MNNLQIFSEEMFPTKHITMYGDWENPLFKATDIANLLEIKNVSQMLKRLDNDDKTIQLIEINGKAQQTHMLTETGLYEVLFSTRHPDASKFRKKVKEILNSVRTNGIYMINQEKMTEEELLANAVDVAQRIIDRRRQTQSALDIIREE